jgi:hypothetical protein
MHPCGLHVCYPKKMGEFGFVQTVKDNVTLFSKRQIARAVQAKDLYEKMIFSSTADFREIVRASIPGCDVTTADAKATKVIWGCLVLKMKGNNVRRSAKCLVQSVIKFPKELIKLQQDVKLAIDCFLSKNMSSLPPTALKYAAQL